jgi:hypothetical protein
VRGGIRACAGDNRNLSARLRNCDPNEFDGSCGSNVGASPVVPHTTSAVAP